MSYFRKHRVLSVILKVVDFDFLRSYIKFSTPSLLKPPSNIFVNARFYHGSAVGFKKCQKSAEKCTTFQTNSNIEAEAALLDYLYLTRSLPFIHAEYMSANSPNFLQNLLEEVQNRAMNGEIGNPITCHLQYHPINEFELFFESSGLKPSEFFPILPRNLIYLADNNLLLQNYTVLCEYGIPRNRIGHIYLDATEVFSYDGGILESKLHAFEDMGLRRSFVCKLVASTPIILIDDRSVVKFLREVNILGIKDSFIERLLKNGKSFNLTQIVSVLCFISKLCDNQNLVREMFLLHPDFLFQESGNKTFSVICFLLKCGFTMQGILSLLMQFPNIKVEKFMQNMRKCYHFLKYINTEDKDVERIVQSHTVMLGSCSLRTASFIYRLLGSSGDQIREMVKKDPELMMKWVVGSKTERLPSEQTKQRNLINEAVGALFDYLRFTRSLSFTLAEYMSKNSPIFLQKLLKETQIGPWKDDIGQSITRYLRDNPINEFEPFFESSGLRPSEFVPILPHNLIYLADDNTLLENYSVLCNYGIPRNKIGNIYTEAAEVFGYEHGILKSKLKAFENLGLHRSCVCKFVTSAPVILMDDGSVVKFVKEINILGLKNRFIEAHLKNGISYNPNQMVGVLCFLSQVCCNKEQVRGLLMQHPDFIFEDSGNNTVSLIGFLLKCGLTMQDILSLFLRFPDIKVGGFIQNARKCCYFFTFIGIKDEDIKRFVQDHTVLIGSCSLKTPGFILKSIGLWGKQARGILKDDPKVLMNWVLGSKIKRLPPRDEKSDFFVEMGFIKDSAELKKLSKCCHCSNGSDLEERVNCFLKAGWDRRDVVEMLRRFPGLLNQSKEAFERKINVLVGDFGIPLSSIMQRPWCLFYAVPKLRLRFTMYGWLKSQGATKVKCKISSIISRSDNAFLERFVNHVPGGPDVWEEFKKESY